MTTIYDDIPIITSDHDEYGFVGNELECMDIWIDDSIAWLKLSVESNVTNDVFIHCVEVLENGLNEDDMINVELNEMYEVVIENDGVRTAFLTKKT